MEFVGEVAADFFGLNQSKYQYVIDAYRREQLRKESEKRWQARQEQLANEEDIQAGGERNFTGKF